MGWDVPRAEPSQAVVRALVLPWWGTNEWQQPPQCLSGYLSTLNLGLGAVTPHLSPLRAALPQAQGGEGGGRSPRTLPRFIRGSCAPFHLSLPPQERDVRGEECQQDPHLPAQLHPDARYGRSPHSQRPAEPLSAHVPQNCPL